MYELAISVDLRDELSERELDELRRHLGIGPRPERLSIVTGFPFVTENESGDPVVEDDPRPLPAGRGAAWRVGGVLCSALADRAHLPRRGWALTSRQEIHPDEFGQVGELLRWLAARAHGTHTSAEGAVSLGCLRSYEDLVPEALQVVNARVVWPTDQGFAGHALSGQNT
ncbi:hypothetical protein ACFXPV_21545 [Streptomyces sp. NPDC059118]|uniref:hypothetical protein n=1 Tax=Streptomyces sp. NPDC059118 TaxID=3346731 RepID=UPI0036948889